MNRALATELGVHATFLSRPRRILLITNIFPPEIGGPATFIDRLAHKLARRGYRVTVVCSSTGVEQNIDHARPFKVRRVSIVRRELYEIKVRFVLFWEMLTHRTILVNGLEGYVAPIAAILRRQYLLKVVGDTAWETARNRGTTALGIDEFQSNAAAQLAHRALVEQRNKVFRHASCVFVPSHYLKRMVVGWGVPPERAVTIPNGIEIESKQETNRDGRAAELHALFVGRLTNWKGVETLLLAMAGLRGVRATIIGDGPQYPQLVELSRQLQLDDRVTFFGRRSREEVMRALTGADVIVLASLYEGLSHTLLEAAALGCPCIASNVGGNAELVTSGVNGLLVPPQDIAALRNALVQLRDDPVLYKRLADGARRLGAEFDMEMTVDRVVQLLAAPAPRLEGWR